MPYVKPGTEWQQRALARPRATHASVGTATAKNAQQIAALTNRPPDPPPMMDELNCMYGVIPEERKDGEKEGQGAVGDQAG